MIERKTAEVMATRPSVMRLAGVEYVEYPVGQGSPSKLLKCVRVMPSSLAVAFIFAMKARRPGP